MYRTISKLITFLFILTCTFPLQSQTCCTAGAPLASSLDILNDGNNKFSLQLAYEYKSINLLVDNNKRIENDPRSRYGQNLSLRIDYFINNKWAVSVLAPMVFQSRSTVSESQNSLGLGDLLLMTQYNLISNIDKNLSLAGGIKPPTGNTDHRASSQILLSPDMQSGSGSFDYLVRLSFTQHNLFIPFMSGYANSLYRRNGMNDNFGGIGNFVGRQFKFGDIWQQEAGLIYQSVTKSGFLHSGVGVKYRYSNPNEEQKNIAPNSGGHWISTPLTFTFTPQTKFSFGLNIELPIFQKLNGLQISTNLTFGFKMRYNI